MKLVVIKNLQGQQTHSAYCNTQEEADAYIAKHSGKAFGLLERVKPTDKCSQEELDLSTNTETFEVNDVQVEHKRLPQMFTVEIINLDQDTEYQLELVRENRRRAYPEALTVIEALMEAEAGDSTKLDEVKAARAAVKALYPKP